MRTPDTSTQESPVNKTLNLVIMIVMAALCANEAYDIVQHGANTWNVLFCLLFGAFAVRRFLLMGKYA